VRRLVLAYRTPLLRRWSTIAQRLDSATAAGSFAGLQQAAADLAAVLRGVGALSTLQLLAFLGAVTPRQAASLCARAFPFAVDPELLLDQLVAIADAASARGAAVPPGATAELAAAPPGLAAAASAVSQ